MHSTNVLQAIVFEPLTFRCLLLNFIIFSDAEFQECEGKWSVSATNVLWHCEEYPCYLMLFIPWNGTLIGFLWLMVTELGKFAENILQYDVFI